MYHMWVGEPPRDYALPYGWCRYVLKSVERGGEGGVMYHMWVGEPPRDYALPYGWCRCVLKSVLKTKTKQKNPLFVFADPRARRTR